MVWNVLDTYEKKINRRTGALPCKDIKKIGYSFSSQYISFEHFEQRVCLSCGGKEKQYDWNLFFCFHFNLRPGQYLTIKDWKHLKRIKTSLFWFVFCIQGDNLNTKKDKWSFTSRKINQNHSAMFPGNVSIKCFLRLWEWRRRTGWGHPQSAKAFHRDL